MGILQVSYILGSRRGSSAPNEPLWLRAWVSQDLNGFEELHQALRELRVKFISCNLNSFCSRVTSGTIESHLENMQRNAWWGTQVEIQAAASLFQVPIHVATNSLIQGAQYVMTLGELLMLMWPVDS